MENFRHFFNQIQYVTFILDEEVKTSSITDRLFDNSKIEKTDKLTQHTAKKIK